MELFTPDIGLMVWMFLSFLIVFFVLAKYAWPAILKGVEERSKFIEDSIQTAKEANAQLAGIKVEGEKIKEQARHEQMLLLKEGADLREKLINEAKLQAEKEAQKVMDNARLQIQKEKEAAVRDIRKQVAELSIEIAEKIIRKNLDNRSAQLELIDKMLDEVTNN